MRETDERLLKAAKREGQTGRSDAFEKLLTRYEKLIYHIAYRYFTNTEDAMDIAQETAVKIYKGLPGVKPGADGSLKSWICAITTHTCLDELRKRRSRVAGIPAEGFEEMPITSGSMAPSAEEAVIARESITELLAAVEALPDDHRTLIILRDMNGLSYQALSEATGVPVNTVKSRLSRARDTLWRKVNKT